MSPHRIAESDPRSLFVRYTHTQRWPLLVRHPVSPALHHQLLAQMVGSSSEELDDLIAGLSQEVERQAETLMADDGFRSMILALPFRDGDRVAAVGDSITADRLGWFELLRAAMRIAGRTGVRLENFGISGNTTADVLERFDLIEAFQPTHVLMMLGTNDARSHGRRVECQMASAAEVGRNLEALSEMIVKDLGAALTVVTPSAVDPTRIRTFFRDLPLRWHAEAVAEVADVVRALDSTCVDVHAAMCEVGVGRLVEADGVHPSRQGQELILSSILRQLTT